MRPIGRGCLLAVALCVGCLKPPDDGPGVGSPGLEPPSERDADGGTPLIPGSSSAGSGALGAGSGGGQQPSSAGGAFGQAGMGGVAPPLPTAGSDAAADPDAGAAGVGAEVDGGALDEDSALFAGLWVVEQPFHALYEATLYEFDSAFMLRALETTLLGAPPRDGYVTGTVATATGIICSFEGGWTALAFRTLDVDARCTDGATRRVRLRFPEGDPSVGLVPIVERVDGEINVWSHRDFDWVWRKCPSRADCMPFSM